MTRGETQQLLARLTADADRICARFGLRYRSLEAERANVKRRYGICYSDGSIKIRLRHATTGEPLRYSSLISTLCHELAHLEHFHHGERFQRYYKVLLEWSRSEGIYRPSRTRPRHDVAQSDPPTRPASSPREADSSSPKVIPGPVQLQLL